jgi:hypothetical protein
MPELDDMCPEERSLFQQLQKHVQELESTSPALRALPASERKKIRNRKASCISRLRRKLAVFDLDRRYQDEVLRCQKLENQLRHVVNLMRSRYDPAFPMPQVSSPRRN